jgi:hypothetical protein
MVAEIASVSALLGYSSFAQTNAPLMIERITLEDKQIARFSVSGPPSSGFMIEGSSDCKSWRWLAFTDSTPFIFIMSPEGRADGIGAPRQGPALFYRLRATNAAPPIVLTNIIQTPTSSHSSLVPNKTDAPHPATRPCVGVQSPVARGR